MIESPRTNVEQRAPDSRRNETSADAENDPGIASDWNIWAIPDRKRSLSLEHAFDGILEEKAGQYAGQAQQLRI
jgi:hypothetical protein